jgi:hypothetical protein
VEPRGIGDAAGDARVEWLVLRSSPVRSAHGRGGERRRRAEGHQHLSPVFAAASRLLSLPQKPKQLQSFEAALATCEAAKAA